MHVAPLRPLVTELRHASLFSNDHDVDDEVATAIWIHNRSAPNGSRTWDPEHLAPSKVCKLYRHPRSTSGVIDHCRPAGSEDSLSPALVRPSFTWRIHCPVGTPVCYWIV